MVFVAMTARAEPVEASVATFDCATAPELLGHPGAEVVSCTPFYGSPTLTYVWLRTSAGAVRRLVLTEDDPPFIGQGLAAAGRYLEFGGLDRNRQLDAEGAWLFLQAADALPPGWTAMDGAGEFPGVGPGTAFRARPFELTLIRVQGGLGNMAPIGMPGGTSRSGRGHMPPVPALYERAVLARSGAGGTWEWSLSTWDGGEWDEPVAVPLR